MRDANSDANAGAYQHRDRDRDRHGHADTDSDADGDANVMSTGGEHDVVTWGLLEIIGAVVTALGTIIAWLFARLFPTKSAVQAMIEEARKRDKAEHDASLDTIAKELKLREEMRDRQHAENQERFKRLDDKVDEIPDRVEQKLRDFFNYTRGGGT